MIDSILYLIPVMIYEEDNMVERMLEQRKHLSQEKKNLKDLLQVLSEHVSDAEQTEEVED